MQRLTCSDGLTAVAVLALAACATASSETPGPPTGFVAVELATVGLDPAADSPVVLLRDPESGKVLPIWVGFPEAEAIARALHGLATPRPMTHDLLADVVHRLGATVEEVRVHELRESTYHAVILLRPRGGAAVVGIDARPSDALALALRTGSSILVARALIDGAPEVDFIAPDAAEQVVQTLGLVLVAVTAKVREEFGLPDRDGVVVSRAFGEARAAGVRRGDLILEVNGQVPETPMEFFDAVTDLLPGGPVTVRYWRGGSEQTVDLFPQPLDRRRGRRTDVRTGTSS